MARSARKVGGEGGRLHALDGLRGWAMLVGVALHAAVPYQSECPAWWAVCDAGGSVAFDLGIVFVHSFRMPVFFVMAGFFGMLLLERRGVGGFVRHRLVRIGVPLVVGWAVLAPVTHAVWVYGGVVASGVEEGAAGLVWDRMVEDGLGVWGLLWHLWFLEYLLVFYGAAVAATLAWRRWGSRRVGAWAGRVAACVVGTWWGPAVLAVPTGAVMLAMEQPWGGDGVTGLAPTWRMLAYYGVYFGFGWVLWARREAVMGMGRWWVEHGLVGVVVGFGGLLFLGSAEEEGALVRAGARMASGVMTAFATVAAMGLFVRWFGRERRWARWVADSSYWVYLVHFPLVVWLGVEASRVSGPSGAKFAAVTVVSTAVLLVTYQAVVRHTPIGLVLNGRRGAGAKEKRPDGAAFWKSE